jgi:hypothetical protein
MLPVLPAPITIIGCFFSMVQTLYLSRYALLTHLSIC